ncbi:MAG: hypothetical protein HYZ15_04900 [Sphingobacteriales bacterium]|nr:hypothetical protein [Sphingobacteriales bacterium]
MKNAFNVEYFNLIDFKLLKGQVESPYEVNREQIASYQFEVGFEMSFNLEEKLVRSDLQLKIEVKNKDENLTEKASGYFELLYLYKVDNLNDLVEKRPEDETLLINAHLANAVASTSYSTARGVLLTRFQGTMLSDFILPVMDPNKLVETKGLLGK